MTPTQLYILFFLAGFGAGLPFWHLVLAFAGRIRRGRAARRRIRYITLGLTPRLLRENSRRDSALSDEFWGN